MTLLKSTKVPKIIAFTLCIIILLLAVFESIVIYAQGNTKTTVRVGWYESAYCRTDSLGRRTGPIYEYQQKISAYTGWSYEYVYGSWSELYAMLEKGEIDLLSDVSYIEERTKHILYSSTPMGEESYYIYVKKDNEILTPEDLSSFNGKTIGVNLGTIQEKMLKEWAQENNLEIKILNTRKLSGDQYLQMLRTGELDALVRMDAYGGKYDFYPILKLGSSDYFFAVSMKKPELLAELNRAMTMIRNVEPNFTQKLNKKYSNSVKTSAVLTDKEKKWFAEHDKIRIGYRDDYLPFSDTDENGDIIGVLKAFIDFAYSSLSNAKLSFEAHPYTTTADAIEALKKGEIDCVFPVNLSPYDGEVMDIRTTASLLSAEIFSVVKAANQYKIYGKQAVSVAITEEHVNHETFIKDYFPQWHVKKYETLEECYQSVANETSDCLLVSSYRINKTDKLRNKYKLSLFSTSEFIDLSFAVRADDSLLYSILNKTVNLIPISYIDYALSTYAKNVERVTFSDFIKDNIIIIFIVLFFILVVILICIALHVQMKRVSNYRQRIIQATEHDPLTALYNRSFFYEYAKRMIAAKPHIHFDAVAMDIEQFHAVNTLLGMEFGDAVLKSLGNEISSYLETTDGIGCRIDADHFGMYCKHRDNYQELFDRFQNKINGLSPNIDMRLRMGVMPWQEGVDPIQLFDRAGTACSKIRLGRKGQLIIYNEDMRKRELHDMRLLNDLRRALDEHEFIAYYQPKYNIQTDPPVLCSAEALVRWQHPELGMIPPNDFIPLFESESKISQLDQYIWREAARQIADWRERYNIELPISVNLSRVDVFDPHLEDILDGIIAEYHLKRSDLHLEVTESAYTEEADQVIKIVSKLREKGYFIEMDDFGTGYSSLNMLSSLPIDMLKLDRSFVIQIFSDEKVLFLVELILDIAKVLHVPVVAEGVETERELEFLKARGCEMAQGYLFSKPIPAAEFEKKLCRR